MALTKDLQKETWEEYKNAFESRFGLTMSPSEKAKLAESLAQKADESVRSFLDQCQSAELILAASNPIYVDSMEQVNKAMREQGACEKFLGGLREAGDLKSFVNSMAPAKGRPPSPSGSTLTQQSKRSRPSRTGESQGTCVRSKKKRKWQNLNEAEVGWTWPRSSATNVQNLGT